MGKSQQHPAAASTAAGWAGENPSASTAKGWAALAQHNSDSDNDAELLPAPAVQMDTDIVTHELCSKAIEQISGKTTLVELRRTVSNIAALAKQADTAFDIGSVALMYDALLQRVADHGSHEHWLDETFLNDALDVFATEQLQSTDDKKGSKTRIQSRRDQPFEHLRCSDDDVSGADGN